jgi:hypothetical protein
MALDLLAFIRLGRIEPCSVSRLFIDPLAEIERAMAKRDEGFHRLNRHADQADYLPTLSARAAKQ